MMAKALVSFVALAPFLASAGRLLLYINRPF